MEEKEEDIKNFNVNFIKENSKSITEQDLQKVSDIADKIEQKFINRGPLKRFLDDGKLLISIIKDYIKGQYRKIPYWAIAAIAFTLLYVLNPSDVVPDILPILGLVDDATLVGVCLYLVERELKDYQIWKKTSLDDEK
jgi:uncharacterized membrane protein YkvA (DUF1232 family)